MIDLQKPKITNLETVGEYSTDSEELFFEWQSEPSYAPIVRYEYSLSTVAYQPSSNWQSTTQKQVLVTADEVNLDLFKNGETYYFFVRAYDASNKVSDIEMTHITIDATPPMRS